MELKQVLHRFLEWKKEEYPLLGNFTHNEAVNNFLTKVFFKGQQPENQNATLAVVAGELICEFTDFDNWVNKASSKIGGYPKRETILCLDNEGHACNIGEDFMAARDNNRFPVKAYLLTRSVKVK